MAQHDIENQVNTEETPLLSDDNTTSPITDVKEEERSTWKHYAINAFWAVLIILFSIVFVKGWIDAGGDVDFDLGNALRKAIGGGFSGAAAMFLQVLLFMPLRTIMNYQYRFGTSFTEANKTLYEAGGFLRYYQGLTPALIQGPLARFGDTAANAGILALLQSNSYLKNLPLLIQTVFASLSAAAFRMVLTPVDTLKTTLQVQGQEALPLLGQRIKKHGISTLWWGAFATAGATFAGHYPWFATYNILSKVIDEPLKEHLFLWLLRLALIGFAASFVSDCVSNSLRVVKTYRQVNDTRVSYSNAAKLVVQNDGVSGLLGRGLPTRILCNGLQGVMFSVTWKLFLDMLNHRTQNNP